MAAATPPSAPGGFPAAPVPPELVGRLRDQLVTVADEVEEEVRRQVPEYAQPEGALQRRLRTGVVEGLTFFVDHIADPSDQRAAIAETHYELGWKTAAAGRSLEAFQSALRVGGLRAWHLMGRTAEDLGLDSALVSALGELAFRTLHEAAEAAAAGYGEARLRDSGELEPRRRRLLLGLLLGEQPAPPQVVQEVAHSARWAVPEQVAVVVFATGPTDAEDPPPTPVGTLTDLDAHPPRLLLPDPDGCRRFDDRALAVALGGRPAVLGPTVPLAQAAQSLRWARRALDLVERGVLPGQGLLRCADHLPALLLRGDEPLLAHLATRALAPLEAVPEAHRDRLRETLLAWLLGGSNVPDTAARLRVHPQTVRYRLRQLDQLFGDALHTPDTRLALMLALQAESTD
ncbi:helix-turn-helix domain-containing protein [Streptomyces sasae]|uniref:PucR family transcriptional regulator n=1 Tax=Streptomyces sasae TaxID=1266772 RepID=UPI00292EB9AE|nr:helix-turn-helix domain-containing protein [Streptomyces sasae]